MLCFEIEPDLFVAVTQESGKGLSLPDFIVLACSGQIPLRRKQNGRSFKNNYDIEFDCNLDYTGFIA